MALRDGYDCVYSGGGQRDGYNLFENPYGVALRDGYDAQLAGLGPTINLRRPRTLYGRQGVAVPTGVILPEATGRGFTTPLTYSVEDLPAGTSFTAATRTLSGTPSADGDNTVTYKVVDSSTPALEAEVTFSWPILDVLSTHGIQVQDFDGGKVGYGVSDFGIVYADTLISGADPGFSGTQALWASPPRIVVGSVVEDPLAIRQLPTGGIMSRIEWRASPNPDQFRLFDSNQDLAGNVVDSDIGAWAVASTELNLYLQRALNAPGVTIDFENDINHSAVWNVTFDVSGTESNWVRNNLADDDQFILVIAEP